MSEPTTRQNIMDMIIPILDEYTKWYSLALSGIVKGDGKHHPNPAGSVFKNTLTTLGNDHFITKERIATLLDLQDNMQTHYEQAIKTHIETPFKDLYESFFTQLRTLERDCVLEDSGLDYLTGLGSKTILLRDIRIELERLARKGSEFSIALIQIDRYDEIVAAAQGKKNQSPSYMRDVAKLIKRTIRSFDAAYRSGLGEFVVILKQSEILGGLSAISRMRKELKDNEIILTLNGENTPLSLSAVVAVPVEHDIAEDLLKNLRADLKNGKGHDEDQSTLLEYNEISPIQRYMQEKKGT